MDMSLVSKEIDVRPMNEDDYEWVVDYMKSVDSPLYIQKQYRYKVECIFGDCISDGVNYLKSLPSDHRIFIAESNGEKIGMLYFIKGERERGTKRSYLIIIVDSFESELMTENVVKAIYDMCPDRTLLQYYGVKDKESAEGFVNKSRLRSRKTA